GRVIAGAVRAHRNATRGLGRELVAGQHVVEAPADVALAHVAPGRPPGVEGVVRRILLAPHVVEGALVEDALEQRALVGALADEAAVSFARMYVHLGARDVDVAAQDQAVAGRAQRRDVRRHRLQETNLAGEVPAAVGDINGRHRRPLDARRRNARVDVELGMDVNGTTRLDRLAHEQRHTRVAFGAVPVAPVVGERELADGARDVIARRLDLLQAQDVGLLARHEAGDLVLTSANAVHVPGCDLHSIPRALLT